MVCIFGQAFLRLLEQIRVQEIGIGLGAQPIERIATVILREVGDDPLFVPLVPLLPILLEQLLAHLLVVSTMKGSLLPHLKM